MALVELLYSVLVSGAGLAASGAVGEFAKGAGKTAFDKLAQRLSGEHDVKSLPLLEGAATNPAFEAAIKDELARPDVAADEEVLQLAATLREAIASLPAETQARYAVNIDEINAGGALLIRAVEGVRAKRATAGGDLTIENVQAPPGKA